MVDWSRPYPQATVRAQGEPIIIHSSRPRHLPPRIRLGLLRLRHLPWDLADRLRGGDELPIPRWGNAFVGGGDPDEIGRRLLDLAQRCGGLAPSDDVLDLGCGIGRFAVQLTAFLDDDASYSGVDIVRPLVGWCRRNIASRHANFRFEHVEAYNPDYNRSSRATRGPVVIPMNDDAVDFVMASSLFTHLQGPAHDAYVEEIARVLRPGGRVMATYFLLNDEVQRMIDVEGFPFAFRHDGLDCRVADPDLPESAVAHFEERVADVYRSHGLNIEIHPGSWPGRDTDVEGQDVLVARWEDEARAP